MLFTTGASSSATTNFKISHGHQLQAVRCLGRIEDTCFFELGQKRVAPADGAGEKLGEKRNEQAVIAEVPFRRIFFPVDID